MADPWLTIIGIGEDGRAGLSSASLLALDTAELVFGGPRHLALAGIGPNGRPWPVPFDVAPVLAARGQRVAVLTSGDPFWHGAGASLAPDLAPGEWRAIPAPSTFSLAASTLGWPLETTVCLGLHAAPFARMRPDLQNGARIICLVRDGNAPRALAEWLTAAGFGRSTLHVLEALGGPRARVLQTLASDYTLTDVAAPVAVAIEARGIGLPRASGLPDDAFSHDGQITKRAIRAMTLSTLAPRRGELLWDIGAGSGSISVEWCRAGGSAIAVEPKPSRAENARENARAFGLDHRLRVIEATAPAVLPDLPIPDAVFIGGGAGIALFAALRTLLPPGTRLVANAVTLETEALLLDLHAQAGGQLARIEIATDEPLGRMRAWCPTRPLVQWSVTL